MAASAPAGSARATTATAADAPARARAHQPGRRAPPSTVLCGPERM